MFFSDRFIPFGSFRVFVRDNFGPSGRPAAGVLPVVFLHGLGSASSIYDPAFEEPFLASRALVFDFLGYGKSDKPEQYPYDLVSQGEVLLAVLNHFGIDRAMLVAHSMGGAISILFAAAHPERVAKLVACEANLFPTNPKVSKKVVSYGSEDAFEQAFDSFVEYYNRPQSPSAHRFYATLRQTTPRALFRSAASLIARVDDDFYPLFLSLPMPRAFLRGADSYQTLSDRMRTDFSARGIPVAVIPNAGHPMMEDNPEGFYAAVRDLAAAP